MILGALVLLAFLLAACSSSATAPDTVDLSGSWAGEGWTLDVAGSGPGAGAVVAWATPGEPGSCDGAVERAHLGRWGVSLYFDACEPFVWLVGEAAGDTLHLTGLTEGAVAFVRVDP